MKKVETDTTPEARSQTKWGDAVTGGLSGFVMVPDVLLRNQARLALSSTEMLVLLNILSHWWWAARLPYPRPSIIAKRMGITTRTVERAIASLEEKDLIKWLEREKKGDKPGIRQFDLSGLVRRVQWFSAELHPVAPKPVEERAVSSTQDG